MPTLAEATTSFKINSELTTPIKSVKEELLHWIQNNPTQCKHTSLAKMSKQILIPNLGLNEKQILGQLYTMSRDQMLILKGRSTSSKEPKNIYINYLHAALPERILADGPDAQVEEARKLVEGAALKREARKILAKQINEQDKLIESASQTISEIQPVKSTPTLEIPLDKKTLENGLSLTLNINFNFK